MSTKNYVYILLICFAKLFWGRNICCLHYDQWQTLKEGLLYVLIFWHHMHVVKWWSGRVVDVQSAGLWHWRLGFIHYIQSVLRVNVGCCSKSEVMLCSRLLSGWELARHTHTTCCLTLPTTSMVQSLKNIVTVWIANCACLHSLTTSSLTIVHYRRERAPNRR